MVPMIFPQYTINYMLKSQPNNETVREFFTYLLFEFQIQK
jgi:hypothetical protein